MTDHDEPGGTTSPKHPETIVYISNLSEDVWPFISAISDSTEKQIEIEENAALSDRDLFSLSKENHILFITPKRIGKEFLSYYRDLVDTSDLEILVTEQHTGEIRRDILKDKDIMNRIELAANSTRKLTMISYATTIQFLELVSELRKRGLTINTPEAPEEDSAWTVNFYGSKSGIRQLSQRSSAVEPDFIMPEGLICTGIVDAARIAANKYVEFNGVVLKTNKGHSGMGLLIFRPGDLPTDYEKCQSDILKKLKKDAFWDMFPIIIEDYVIPNLSIGGGFPNVEYKISRNRHIDFLYYCSLRVTDQGVFKGVEILNDVLPDRVAAQITDTGFFIAEQYSEEGYRGYFDVDFVAAKNGKLYVTETNARRTGGTHVFYLAEKLFGKDFMYETFILSNNLYTMPDKKLLTFHDVRNRLQNLIYNKKTREGVVIIAENIISRHYLGYVIFGKTRKRALEIEAEMERLLQ